MSDSALKDAWVLRVFGVQPRGAGRSAEPAAVMAPAMAEWQATRGVCLKTLGALEKAIRGLAHRDSNAAIILLRAIQSNLTAAPTTPQQVAALENYLQTDDIIVEAEAPNGFGIEVALRAPLLRALAGLRAAQAKAAGQ